MIEALRPLVRALLESLEPLRSVVDDPSGRRFQILIRELGWDVQSGEWFAGLPFVAKLKPAVDEALGLAATLADDDAELGSVVVAALEASEAVVAALLLLADDPPDGSDVPAELRTREFWAELAGDLPEYLLITWLSERTPVVYATLRLAGLIESVTYESQGTRAAVTVEELRLARVTELLRDPVAALRERWGWTRSGGVSSFDEDHAAALLAELARLARAGKRPVRLAPLASGLIGGGRLIATANPLAGSTRQLELPLIQGFVEAGFAELGLVAAPIPERPADSAIAGLFVGNLSWGTVAGEVALSDEWVARISADASATATLGLALVPDQPAKPAVTGPDASLEVIVARASAAPSVIPIGTPTGTRVEIRAVEASVALEVDGGQPELRLGLQTVERDGQAGISLVVEPGQGDAFVSELLGAEPLEVTLDAALSWSSKTGLRLEGGAGVEFVVPINEALGPIYLDEVTVKLELGTSGVTVEAGLTASADLGPFVLVVDGVGFRARLTSSEEASGLAVAKFGDVAITIDFKPPDGVGVSLDAGVGSGGGYLYFDPDAGRYAGTVQLELLSFGLTAIGILDTKLPDGSEGWALLLSICAELAPIPLGFGFTLNGVGGLIGINRSIDTDVIAAAIPDGSIDWILFPDDPIAGAPAMLAGMDAAFPVRRGSFVLGPMVQIGWGVPTIVEISAGILITLPDPIEIALIGQLDVVLGTDEVALLELHVDLLGTIDFEAGELAIFANIRKSHLIGIPLRGSMAFVADFVGNPYFLLSFGGFNPDYNPPVPLPYEMARMGFELDLDEIQVTLGSYFAVTSNSVQFGSEFSVVAKAMGFTAEGACYFHVLFLFDPFRLTATVGFDVSISAGNRQLLAVGLSLTVKGPNRWEGTGTATFKVLGKGIDFRVSGAFGKREPTTPLARVDVLGKLRAALQQPEAWAGLAPARSTVRLREVPTLTDDAQPEDINWIHPDGRVEIKQTVAPLGIALDRYGHAEIQGLASLTIDKPRLGGEDYEGRAGTLEDYFAPAEFFDLSKAEKLSSPGFELLDAGIVFGGEGVAVGEHVDVEMSYEEWTWIRRDEDPVANPAAVPGRPADLVRGLKGSLASKLAREREGGGRFRRATGEVMLRPEAHVVADVRDATVDAAVTPAKGVRRIEAVLARRDLAHARERVVLPKSESGKQAS